MIKFYFGKDDVMCVCCRNLGICLENAIFGLLCSRQIGKAKKHCERTSEVTIVEVSCWVIVDCAPLLNQIGRL